MRRRAISLVEVITVIAIMAILFALLLPAINAAREMARRVHCRNNLRQLGIAAQNHLSSEGYFPPGVQATGDDFRRGLHSGFVFLLPFMEEQVIYERYNLKRPWDDPRNAQWAFIDMPIVLCPSSESRVPDDGGLVSVPTDYAFSKGSLAYLCEKPAGNGMFDINSRVRDRDVHDGISKTFAFGEAASSHLIIGKSRAGEMDLRVGQAWSKANFDGGNDSTHVGGHGSVLAVTSQNPGPDQQFGTRDDILAPLNSPKIDVSRDANAGNDCSDPDDRVRGFYSFHPGAAHFVFGDTHVRVVDERIDPATYRALSTIAGGERILDYFAD